MVGVGRRRAAVHGAACRRGELEEDSCSWSFLPENVNKS